MTAFGRLRTFLLREMRMSHVYQPLMLRTLLEHGGAAAIHQIAASFLARDESQLDYYETIVTKMPGPVLQRRGLVVREGDGYRLAPGLTALSAEERAELLALCDAQLDAFVSKRGAALWAHRAVGLGRIPGRLRYETLACAGFRCELCGVSADERALDVDHILPRKHGGEDRAENLQALCWQCNTNKGAGDATDFRAVRASHAIREAACPFCTLTPDRIVAENAVALAIRDGYPVTPLHTLVLPKRHVSDFFTLADSEVRALYRLAADVRRDIQRRDATVAGFNLGVNGGAVAGQTIAHCHLHVIPRRVGDVANPRGGVRATIPGRADYAPAPHGQPKDDSGETA